MDRAWIEGVGRQSGCRDRRRPHLLVRRGFESSHRRRAPSISTRVPAGVVCAGSPICTDLQPIHPARSVRTHRWLRGETFFGGRCRVVPAGPFIGRRDTLCGRRHGPPSCTQILAGTHAATKANSRRSLRSGTRHRTSAASAERSWIFLRNTHSEGRAPRLSSALAYADGISFGSPWIEPDHDCGLRPIEKTRLYFGGKSLRR